MSLHDAFDPSPGPCLLTAHFLSSLLLLPCSLLFVLADCCMDRLELNACPRKLITILMSVDLSLLWLIFSMFLLFPLFLLQHLHIFFLGLVQYMHPCLGLLVYLFDYLGSPVPSWSEIFSRLLVSFFLRVYFLLSFILISIASSS